MMTFGTFDIDSVPAEHGYIRRRGYVREVTTETFTTPQGEVELPLVSHEYTVEERWCEKCGKWVDAKGIMGALLCPVCHSTWDKRYWEE